jgi:hypothetical protein
VANIKPKNIVPLSHIRIFSLKSNHQNGIKIQTNITEIFIINIAFSFNQIISSKSIPSVSALLKSIIQSKKSMKNDIVDNPAVFHWIPSLQFKALKINTYQIIVKNRGIIKIV